MIFIGAHSYILKGSFNSFLCISNVIYIFMLLLFVKGTMKFMLIIFKVHWKKLYRKWSFYNEKGFSVLRPFFHTALHTLLFSLAQNKKNKIWEVQFIWIPCIKGVADFSMPCLSFVSLFSIPCPLKKHSFFRINFQKIFF